jgi:hypothetical protein
VRLRFGQLPVECIRTADAILQHQREVLAVHQQDAPSAGTSVASHARGLTRRFVTALGRVAHRKRPRMIPAGR